MGKIVKFIESNLLPLIRALNENTEEGEFTIGMEDNAPVGGEYYHVMDDEQDDISENTIISENSTDRRVNSIIKKYSGVDDFNEIRTIRSNILKLIPNARAKNDMYLGAVAMWYLTGSLNDASDRFKLNYILGKLHQGASFGYGKILNEQDFGMVPFNTMKQIMDELIPSEETENSYKSGKKIQKVGNYTIYRMDSYDDTKYVRSQLSQVHWCIFEDDGTFSYMSEGYTVYICVRDGYENARMMSYDELVEKLLSHGMTNAVESLEENYPKDDMYDDFVFDIAYDGDETAELLFVDNEYELGLPPCDDYGLSMFVVMVSNETYKNGRAVMVYSRYNLPNMFDGNILSVSELSSVIGADAMSIFTPNGNVQESKDKKHSSLIIESQESKSIAAAKKLVMQRLNYNEQEADEFIRIKLRNDLPVLRTPHGGKFILGVTRMFCDGELRTANDIGNLNSTLKLVASDAHINEYDRNLNNLSYQELVQRFAKAMSDNLEAEKAEIGQMAFNTPSDYEIIRIDSFEQAEEYGQYVSWCVTHDEDMFDSYTSDGINQFYFCLKNGFENVEETPSEGCPLDEYGLSMIAVSVNENGMLNTCTCRWNHDNGGDDSVMDTKQVSKVIGMNFFEVFKPNSKWRELIANVMQRIANGEDPRNVFDYVDKFREGFAKVDLNDRCNFINQEGKLLSDQWFDSVGFFKEGFGEVYLNGKCNFINKEGRVISNQWFDGSYGFKNGFARVWIDWKFNFINQEGRLLSDQWFGKASDFCEGFAIVKLRGKYNFINQEGRVISSQWFEYVYDFREGFAMVKLKGKWNYINQEGRLLSDQWFDNVGYFCEGFSVVYFNDKWNFINQEGKLLSDQWFDNVYNFREGFAKVILNGKTYKIDTNGKLYIYEGKNKRKNIIISENKIELLKENLEFEVDSSEVDLSSFKKQDSLPSIWKDEDTLDSKVRLKLLDIADDFWDFVNVTWVEPKGIIITGSLCNYNWSDYSDVDLHLIVDFNEIGDREDFVRQYLDSKKNEWNDEHGSLKIYGYPVELYVQNINEDVSAGGIYDLEENKWIRKPSYNDIDEIDSESDEIKDEAARIMTIIDDMWGYFNKTNDNHKLESLGNDADNLWKKIKDMRKSSLEDGGEMSNGNIVYKYMRRKKYLDKLFDLRAAIYDKTNTITEGVSYDKFRDGQAFRYRIIGSMIKDGYLFHGTDSEFDEFESDRIHGDERGVYGYGAYFTNAAYKCEEYGNHFTILDGNDFIFLDIEEKVRPEWNIFKEKLGEFSKIEAGLDNARSNREYDYYNNLYDEYRSTVDSELLERFVSILEKNGATDYNTLNKLVDYSFTNSENKDIQKRISQLYLSMGYDGFVCENQYIIFNFKKLNDNIVKDKEKLISKYSIDESKSTGSKLLTEWDRTDYFEKAKEYFGTTNDLNECGFILPDGEMLDLSSSKGRRGIPHRNVEAIGIGLETFIEHGAIRCDSRYKLINICKRPTKEQIIRLVEIIKANNGSVSLDLGNGHVTFDYVDYKNANYKRIINDIINFFDNKIKPSSLYESKNIINNNESVRKFLILLKENSLNEEIVADGNSEHNPYAKRWKAERDALKNFLKNFGKIMTSKENGKQYKVFQDQALSNLIGYNYCICIQWDPIKMEVGSTPYIRAFDKFTYRIFQAQFDDRGRDNLRATADDIGNSYQPIQTIR